MSLLEQKGYEVYIVGGAVRDILRGVTPHDYDAATSAKPDQILSIMQEAGIECINGNGLKHGTVTSLYGGRPFEMTTFRRDGDYSDSRHPDSVEFTSSIEEDVRRRDFTVNAMYLDKDGNVRDLVGGREDLAARIIRAVGDPDRRFSEDALRILRGIRFAAKLDMSIDPDTGRAMRDKAPLLKNISAERIFSELSATMTAPAAGKVLAAFAEVTEQMIPGLSGTANRFDLFDRIPQRDETTGFAILFYGLAPEAIEAAADRLKFPSGLKKNVLTLLSFREMELPTDGYGVKYLRASCGRDTLSRLLDIRDALGEDTEDIRQMLSRFDEEGVPSSLKDLTVNGDDITAAGIPAGKEVGQMLNNLLTLVLKESVENDREALIKKINELKDKKEY